MSRMMTRRQMLLASASLAASAAFFQGCGTEENVVTAVPVQPSPSPVPPAASPSPGASLETFVQPPVRSAQNGLLSTSLTCKMAENNLAGTTIKTRTYEGMIGGPTLRVRPGDTLRINMINAFPPNPDQNVVYPNMNTPHEFNTTNNHTHGLHVSPGGNSDNVFVEIDPGESFPYEYKIPADHPTGTFWYHPHKHGSTSEQLFGGMGAALIVEGPGLDTVPEVAAARDLVYLINELNIDPSTGQVPPFVAPNPPTNPNSFPLTNRILTVNGQTTPVLVVRSGEVVRLRVINAAVRTTIPFVVDGHDLNVCSLDGITLPQVRSTPRLQLAAANRADILLRGGTPGTYAIRKATSNTDTNTDPEVILGYMEVVGPALQPPMGLPTVLPVPKTLPDILSSEITRRRTLVFSISNSPGPLAGFGNFLIDNGAFNPNVINHSVKLNAVEEWTLLNTSGTSHPFHIHINPFQVVSINDVPLPQPEWKDTVEIPKANGNTPGKVVIRHRFQDFTGLYVLHCHILVHEDLGMMQTVEVTP